MKFTGGKIVTRYGTGDTRVLEKKCVELGSHPQSRAIDSYSRVTSWAGGFQLNTALKPGQDPQY